MFDRNAIDSSNIVDYLADIFARRGAESYLGEKVSMAGHMLQAAQLAEQSGADSALVVAALLHDIGHYSNEIPDTALMSGTDNYHEDAGASFLASYFPASVTEPIRQHVAAKRYLCAVDEDYYSGLSEASQYTLKVQGGPMSEEEVAQFKTNPYLQDCVQLRKWDDLGKNPALEHRDFSYYRSVVEALVEDAKS